MADITEKNLAQLWQQVAAGRVVMFVGAGVSRVAGGPTGKKLTQLVKERFPDVDQGLDDFIDVCQDVIDTPPYNRNELEQFIRNTLDLLKPATAHKKMIKYNWQAIFTTNFDDLLELAYREPGRTKVPIAICEERPSVNVGDMTKIHIFKLMGSMSAAEESSGCMVLSRSDYNRALVRRAAYWRLLSDFLKAGVMVFIGYSFGDRLALDIMDEIVQLYGKDRLPWSYALFDNVNLDAKAAYMFSSRKIIPLAVGFEKFIEYLEKRPAPTVSGPPAALPQLMLMGRRLDVDEHIARQCDEFFEILHEDKVNQDAGDKDEYFRGTNRSWGAFREKWDFERALYSSPGFERVVSGTAVTGCVKDRIFDELRKLTVEENKIILITGMAGSGKTTLLRRLAYDIYRSGQAPVVLIGSAGISFDDKLLAAFVEHLNYLLNKEAGERERLPPIKLVVIIDNAGSAIRHINRIKNSLTARGRLVLIIAAERKGEWDMMWKLFPFKLQKENMYELSERLTEEEKRRIIDHLYRLGYVQTPGTFWDDLIQKDYEDSFFATVYTLVHPSKKPLNDIIKDQYQTLTDLTQSAFRNICFFHRFNLPINFELLVRSLRCSYDTFHKEVIEKDSAKVIFEEQDETGNLLYRAHHRIIASKTVDFFFGDRERQKNVFLEIFREAVLANRKEREICESLMIDFLGPNARSQIFSPDQQRQLFEAICEKYAVRCLVHHWGLLESDAGHHREAERLLRQALEMPRDGIESYRGESDQSILTSLGRLYSRMGIEALKGGDDAQAQEHFNMAEECFNSAKYGDFPNRHPYHAHALMWLMRARREASPVEKLRHYAMAVDILSIAKDNLNDDDLQEVYGLETQIWLEIGDVDKIIAHIEVLRDKYRTASGYYLHAQLLWKEALATGSRDDGMLRQALAIVDEALGYFPNDWHCLYLKAKLMKVAAATQLNDYYDILQKCKAVLPTSSVWLFYELGRVAFLLGYYDDSREFFNELETGIGIGHGLRTRPQNHVVRTDGTRAQFEGTVEKIHSSYDGEIRCTTLRNLRYAIPFRPIACGFYVARTDVVGFNIAFNFRGPVAINVRKM